MELKSKKNKNITINTDVNDIDMSNIPNISPIQKSSLQSSDTTIKQTWIKTGMWTPEEDTITTALILDFKKGILEDCTEGTSLRNYLSGKLQCSPMRISKKFMGCKIGKVSIIFIFYY
jgi:hypothetical protein